MGNERIAGANCVRRGVPVTGAVLFAAALVCGGGQAIVPAAAAPPAAAAGSAGVISAIVGGRFHRQAMTSGDIYTIAGAGTGGLGDGAPAASSTLSAPADIALGSQRNLVIADTGHDRVRMVAAKTGWFYGQAMTAGDIYTIAGKGAAGFAGDGGPAVKARLHRHTGVALDAAGNVLISDSYNELIRVLAARAGTFYGRAMTAGDIYTIAGNGTQGFSGDGGPATAARLNTPLRTTVDAAGNVVISDSFNQRIRVLAARTGTFYGRAMTAGDIYTIAGNGTAGFSGDGGPATATGLYKPLRVMVDAAGNLVFCDERDNRIRVVAVKTGRFYGQAMTAGDIYTIAGTGKRGTTGDRGPATRAEVGEPAGITQDSLGNLLIATRNGGRVRVVAAKTGRFYGQAMTAGDIYTIAGGGAGGLGDGGPATSAVLMQPGAVMVGTAGNVLIADTADKRIREVAEPSAALPVAR
jgi:trimeric autotransporter adhesin